METVEQRTFGLKALGGFLVLIGLFCLWMAYGKFADTLKFVNNSVRINGIVTSMKVSSGPMSSSKGTFPIVTLETGRVFQSQYGAFPSPQFFRVGQKVGVLVDKIDSRRLEIDSFFPLWFWTISFVFFALVFLTPGLGCLFERPKE